jgi:hypothetical protein
MARRNEAGKIGQVTDERQQQHQRGGARKQEHWRHHKWKDARKMVALALKGKQTKLVCSDSRAEES